MNDSSQRHLSGRQRRPPPPWWRLATLVLLLGAFGISATDGRLIETVIIGVLLVPTIALIGVWVLEVKDPQS